MTDLSTHVPPGSFEPKPTEKNYVDEYMNIQEVPEWLHVEVSTVRWLRYDGRFAPAIKVGRRIIWRRSDVQAWLDTHAEAAA